ncbi:DUF1642 domain-containing protein [Enterococcus faecium]|uniref:DUF1642 domain-containing protein n=1 Tax=Enterococcus faecium TaxID=1352 RepID=UPI002E78BB15|nr:DUF1642 domain-containing protein [Enterococcus faecium]
MDKREVIKELASHWMLGSDTRSHYYNEGISAGITILNKLDEPQKPVVPKFVAEWFEENKDDLEFPIWELCVDSYGSKDEHGMLNWIQQSENNPIETLIRMKDGYEVEKEPLYEVIIGDLYLIKKFNNRNDFYFDTSCSLCAWEKSAYQLTEAEIKAIDGRFWPFAVPVEGDKGE